MTVAELIAALKCAPPDQEVEVHVWALHEDGTGDHREVVGARVMSVANGQRPAVICVHSPKLDYVPMYKARRLHREDREATYTVVNDG